MIPGCLNQGSSSRPRGELLSVKWIKSESWIEMLERYRTVRGPGNLEIVIKKSRFIGHIMPVTTEEEAVAFIDEIKKKHWNATHNCSAYMIGKEMRSRSNPMTGNQAELLENPFLKSSKISN